MSNPIVFTSEQERLKAREWHLNLCRAIYPGFEPDVVARDFDERFPPIAPPRMVPEEWWVLIRPDGKREGPFFDRTSKPTANPGIGYRVARVRVEEVDE